MLGVPGTGEIEAIGVEAGVKPLDIRRGELSIRQATRVIMKDNNQLIKSAWDSQRKQNISFWANACSVGRHDVKHRHQAAQFGKRTSLYGVIAAQ